MRCVPTRIQICVYKTTFYVISKFPLVVELVGGGQLPERANHEVIWVSTQRNARTDKQLNAA